MKTDIRRRDPHLEHQPPRVDGQPSSDPIARVVAGSLTVGLAIAVLLVTAVFPGAAEATITGSLLGAFGLGWGLLGWAANRFTTRALPWTRVPAIAMTVTGLALVVCDPQDDAMRTIAWIWPVPALALAGHVWVHARRTVPRRGRWMLTGTTVVLVVAALGAAYEDVSVVRDQSAYAAPGRTYDVNGHRLYLDCRGQGGPTVVLFNGMGEVSVSWSRIVDLTDGHTRVCAYDRAGQGWSGNVARPQDGTIAAEDLHTLLQTAGEQGPFVLAGHSIGGTYALAYAATYPSQVAGMVLLDSSSPHQFDVMPAYPSQYALMRRGMALMPTLDRLGVGRLTFALSPSHLPEPDADVATSLMASARAARNTRDELAMLPELFDQAQALTTLHDLPLAVLSARENVDGMDGWARAQDRLAALSTNHLHRVIDSTHMGLLEDRVPAVESAHAIIAVVDASRAGGPLDAS